MSVSLRWELGGDAELISVDDDRVTLRSSRVFPPGAPARGTLCVEPELPITVKVAGSRREADGRFVVRGRLVSPTVALRAALRPAP